MTKASKPTCWIMTDGTIGMEVQCRGLAAALGLEPVVKRFRPNPLLRLWPTLGRIPLVAPALTGGDALEPPWPDMTISLGRRAAGAAIAVRARSGGWPGGRTGGRTGRRTVTVHLQDPRLDPSNFDLLVLPEHDPTRGDNVILHTGSLNDLTETTIAASGNEFAGLVASVPHPRVAVLIGGGALDPDLPSQIARIASDGGCGLMVTTSRRTPESMVSKLRACIPSEHSVLWTGDGINPYRGFLAHADAFVVTGDSVNMTSEACWFGKPVHVVSVSGLSPRIEHFQNDLSARGLTHPFDGRLEISLGSGKHTPLRETERVAAIVAERLHERGIDLH
ncbi:MAG: hypothetical protein HOH65_12705 [Rhodospirillaceae bacterium]|nr:hypothetical protein [Rhodospirillaceae bacterium]